MFFGVGEDGEDALHSIRKRDPDMYPLILKDSTAPQPREVLGIFFLSLTSSSCVLFLPLSSLPDVCSVFET